MTNGTKVKKRNGAIEPLNLEKMHVMVELACDGLAGVSASQVEIQSGIQFYDGISTGAIVEAGSAAALTKNLDFCKTSFAIATASGNANSTSKRFGLAPPPDNLLLKSLIFLKGIVFIC